MKAFRPIKLKEPVTHDDVKNRLVGMILLGLLILGLILIGISLKG